MSSDTLLQELSIPARFEQQAARTPDHVALVHRGRTLTYAALNARANRIARYLQRHGVTRETRVGIWGERDLETVAALLGIAKAGGAYVPVDPSTPAARIAESLANANARLLVVPDAAPPLHRFDGTRLVLSAHAADIDRESPHNLGLATDPEQVCAVLFTSGTTGTPKGILMRAAGVAHLVTGMATQFPYAPTDTFLLHRSLTIVGSIWEYFGPLLHGARGVIVSGDDARDPETIWRHFVEDRVTHIIVSPTLADALIRHGLRHGLTSAHMRVSIIGGEPVSRRTIAGWRGIFPAGQHLICYGITESMYIAFFDTAQLDPHEPDDLPVPVGRPFHKATVRIVDDAMALVAPGEVGEICVSSPCVSRGYLNAPRLTSARFVADPWASDPRGVLYRTGDLGCWREDGLLDVRGRRDRQVKIRGFRVELDEVEAALRHLPQVRNAVVAVGQDARRQARLIAYVESDAVIVPDDLRRALRVALPDYMVPALIVPVPAIPITAGGKIDRRALEESLPSAGRAVL